MKQECRKKIKKENQELEGPMILERKWREKEWYGKKFKTWYRMGTHGDSNAELTPTALHRKVDKAQD